MNTNVKTGVGYGWAISCFVDINLCKKWLRKNDNIGQWCLMITKVVPMSCNDYVLFSSYLQQDASGTE